MINVPRRIALGRDYFGPSVALWNGFRTGNRWRASRRTEGCGRCMTISSSPSSDQAKKSQPRCAVYMSMPVCDLSVFPEYFARSNIRRLCLGFADVSGLSAGLCGMNFLMDDLDRSKERAKRVCPLRTLPYPNRIEIHSYSRHYITLMPAASFRPATHRVHASPSKIC